MSITRHLISNNLNAFGNLVDRHARVVGTGITVAIGATAYFTPHLISHEVHARFSDMSFSQKLFVAVPALLTLNSLTLLPQIKPASYVRTGIITLAYTGLRTVGAAARLSVIGLKVAGQASFTTVGTTMLAAGMIGSVQGAIWLGQQAYESLPDKNNACLFGLAAIAATGMGGYIGKQMINFARTGFTTEPYVPGPEDKGYQYSFEGRLAPKTPSHSTEFNPVKFLTISQNLANLGMTLKKWPRDITRVAKWVSENGDKDDGRGYLFRRPSRVNSPEISLRPEV